MTETYINMENNNSQLITQILDEMDNWPHAQFQIKIRDRLKAMFGKYNDLNTPTRERLDQLIIKHKQYCNSSTNTSYMRQHNTFVLFYIECMSTREIASAQAIRRRTVFKDLIAVLDRMLIFLLGFYGVRWDKR